MKEVYYVGLNVYKDSIQLKEPVFAKGNRASRVVKEPARRQEMGKCG
jgi:hypothetical protein